MGAWGTGLYSGDFAVDLKAAVSAVCRLPLAEEELVVALCRSHPAAAAEPANEDHAVFWLVLADQFEKRRIFSPRVRGMAIAIIDEGKDGALMQSLGMKPGGIRKRTANLAELRARLAAQPEASAERKTIKAPQPYVFELYGVYAYPMRGGEAINPYMTPKYFDRAAWRPDGHGLMLIVRRGRAFGYLSWYVAVKSTECLPAVPDRQALVGGVRWRNPIYGSCSRSHFRKLELSELGVFSLDPTRVDHFFPHLAEGTVQAVCDISIANRMGLDRHPRRDPRRRPDGKVEPIVYPLAPNLVELGTAQ